MDTLHLRRARFDRARWWLEQGVAVVPLKPGSKELQPGYGSHAAHITDTAFAGKWFLRTDANLGVVLGGGSGLAVADWDDEASYESWRQSAGAQIVTLTERTPRGYHAFFYGSHLPSCTAAGCEFKTTGACTAAPSVSGTGVVYQIVHDSPIVSLTQDLCVALFPFLSGDRLVVEPPESPTSAPRRATTPSESRLGVIARIKQARTIVDEMRAMGVELRPGGQTVLVGLCPFHDDHTPSLWVNPATGVWGCNQPRCPAVGFHDVINLRALARSISNRDAIQQLAREFLG